MAYGMLLAVVLVYLLMAVNFQSWLDPLIILMALPGAIAGVLWMLLLTQTNISVPALMGAIMCIGVATSNSNLLVTFANDQRREEGWTPHAAALEAGHDAPAARADDRAGDDPRHAADVARARRGRRAERAARPRRHRRPRWWRPSPRLFFVPVVYSRLRRKPVQTDSRPGAAAMNAQPPTPAAGRSRATGLAGSRRR